MNHLSNTPPDGDFVRYVERLTQQGAKLPSGSHPAQAEPVEDMRQPTQRPVHQIKAASEAAELSRQEIAAAFRGIRFTRHLPWLFGAWLISQVAARAVPGAGWLMVPVLFFYATWIFTLVNENRGGQLKRDIQNFLNSQSIKPPGGR